MDKEVVKTAKKVVLLALNDPYNEEPYTNLELRIYNGLQMTLREVLVLRRILRNHPKFLN